MTRITERATHALPLLLPILLTACGGDSNAPPPPSGAAAFSVNETVSAPTAIVGDTLTWTVTATNSGTAASTDTATLLVNLPATGLSGLTLAATGATCGPAVSTLTCTIPSGLATGASATVTFSGTTTTIGTLASNVQPTSAGATTCASGSSTIAGCSTKTTVGAKPAAISLAAAFPASGASAAQADTMLQMTFNVAPTLGTTGKLSVFKSDGTLVDAIDVSGAPTTTTAETYGTAFPETNTEVDAIAAGVTTLSGDQRFVYYTPITISGKTATVHLHDGKLLPGTSYYVTADSTLFNDGNGNNFTGLSSPTNWTFTTGATPTLASLTSTTVPAGAPTGTTSVVALTVDAAGNGNFNTVQGALDWVMQNCGTGASGSTCSAASVLKQITIDKGTYNELLYLRNVNNLTLKGSTTTPTDTVVAAENFESFNPGTGGSKTAAVTTNTTEGSVNRRALGGGRAVFLIEGADLLTMRYFTLQNTHVKASSFNNQAETFYYNSSTTNGSRLVGSHMRYLSAQDTIQTKGWAYFSDTYVAGDVDFIWGNPYAVMLDHSELHTVFGAANLNAGVYTGGYDFQARAFPGYLNGAAWIATPGFVVSNSVLTADANVPAGTAYLARSGGAGVNCTSTTVQGTACDSVAYVNTQIGPHIAAAGWFATPAPSPSTGQSELLGWREWGSTDSTGAVLSMTSRDTTVGTYSIALTGSAATSDLTVPAVVFSAWNNGAGWTPVP